MARFTKLFPNQPAAQGSVNLVYDSAGRNPQLVAPALVGGTGGDVALGASALKTYLFELNGAVEAAGSVWHETYDGSGATQNFPMTLASRPTMSGYLESPSPLPDQTSGTITLIQNMDDEPILFLRLVEQGDKRGKIIVQHLPYYSPISLVMDGYVAEGSAYKAKTQVALCEWRYDAEENETSFSILMSGMVPDGWTFHHFIHRFLVTVL